MIRQPAPRRAEGRWLAGLLIGVAVVAGAWLRFDGLSSEPLRADELNHYYVAESLRAGGGPVLPSGEWYARGIDYSRLVGVALLATNHPELAVRLPAALFGWAAIVIFAIGAWHMAGPGTAVWAAGFLAIFPPALEQSRNGRFYTMQLAFGLVAMFAGWRLVRRAGARLPPDGRSRLRLWGWAVLALIAWGACLRLQVTTLSVGVVWILAIVAAAGADVRRWGTRAFEHSVPLQVASLCALGAGAVLLARPELIGQLGARAFEVPYWARAVGSDELSYARIVLAGFPVLGWIAPLAFVVLVRRRPRLGLYVLAWFLVPLALHAVLPWKATRFVLLALPALLIAVGYGITHALVTIRSVVRRATTARAGGLRAELLGYSAACALALLLVITNPTLSLAVRNTGTGQPPEWSESGRVLRDALAARPMPVGHANSLVALHYWGRLDFTVNEGLRERWLSHEERARRGLPGDDGYVRLPMGSPDLYTGAPVLTSPDAIRTHFASAGGVLIGVDSERTVLEGVSGELLHMLEREAEELCRGRCGRMRLYWWRLAAAAPLHAAAGATPQPCDGCADDDMFAAEGR